MICFLLRRARFHDVLRLEGIFKTKQEKNRKTFVKHRRKSLKGRKLDNGKRERRRQFEASNAAGKLSRMFHEDEGSVDVELLAECGQIAQRLRGLERTWFLELKDLQRQTLLSSARPPLPSSLSATQKLNEIFDNNNQQSSNQAEDDDPTLVKRLRFLEDATIKIHRKDELLKLTEEQKRATNNRKEGDIQSNMNYSVTTTKDDNNDPTTFPTELKDDQQSQTSRCLNNDAEKDATEPNCGEKVYYHHQCGKVNDSDLRMLIRELKRKVDFTEKMNWLCE